MLLDFNSAFRYGPLLASIGLFVFASSCRSSSAASADYAMQAQPLRSVEGPSVVKSPRGRAVQSLIKQGKTQLEQGDEDAALASFGRGISLDPNCGACEYGLAEAWLKKGDREQAREHHLRALRLLGDKVAWRERLNEQKKAL